MSQVRSDVGILSDTIGGISGAARTMTFAFTTPMVALGTYAVSAASNFDAAMRNINSILGLSEDKFSGLQTKVLDFAKTTRDGVVPATEALYEIFSAGVTDQERALEIWRTSTKVAEAGVADLTQTTNAITATMSAFNLETTDAARVGNIWTRMVQVGVGSMGDFLSNAQKILPLSSALNISLEDMGASIAFLSQGGGGAAKAETSFAMMLSNLMKPTTAMTEAFDKLGVSTGTELLKKFGSVGNAVKALKDVSDEISFNKMFSKTGLEAALRMTNNFDALNTATVEFNKNLDSATMDAWTEQSKSFAFQLDLFKTALQGVANVIGQAILPIITPMVQGFTQVMTQISDANPQVIQMGVAFVALVAAAAPIVWLLTSMLNPIGLVVGAIGVLVTAFSTNFGGIRDQVTADVNSILGVLTPLKDGIQTFLDALFGTGTSDGKSAEDKLKDAIGIPHEGIGASDIIQINPNGQPISLWDFYSGEGFIDEFSWTEFQKMAKDAGWDGKAIKPGDVLNLLAPTSSATSEEKNHFMNALLGLNDSNPLFNIDEVTKNVGGDNNRVDNSIGGKIARAFEQAWPVIKPALENIWTNIQTWFSDTFIPGLDTKGGDILGSIARWFLPVGSTGKGNTKTFQVLQGALNGGVADTAEGVANDFQKNFPTVANALSNLFQNMGTWIQNEGIPTIARSIGFLAGKLSVVIGQALGSIWSSLTGGQTAKGAGQLASDVSEEFAQPLSEGFQDALAGSGVTNPFDVFFTNLSGLLVAGAIAWKIAPDFATNAISKIAGAITTELGTTTVFSNLGTSIVSKIGTIVWPAGGILDDIALRGMFAVDGIRTALTNAVTTAAGSMSIPVLGLIVGTLLLTAAAVTVASESGTFNPVGHKLSMAISPDDIQWEEGTNLLDTILQNAIPNQNGNYVVDMPGTVLANITDFQLDMAGLTRDNVVAIDVLPEEVRTPYLEAWKKLADDSKSAFAEQFNTGTVPTADQLGQKSDGWSNLSGVQFNNPLVDTILTPPTEEDITTKWATPFAENMTSAATASMAMGNFDGQSIVDTMLTPLANGFIDNFGVESPAYLAWSGFADNLKTTSDEISTKFYTIDQDMILLKGDAATNMPILQSVMVGAFHAINVAALALDKTLYLILQKIAQIGGATIPTSIPTANTDGSHALGLSYVPFDGYIAELHKGERVLTAAENSSYSVKPNAVTPSVSNSTSSTVNSPTINVYGVTDANRMIREMERMGYDIKKR